MLKRRNKKNVQQVMDNGGMMDEAGQVVNGTEVPAGSLVEEVADDVPAMLSEGEFVVPADVVRFVGLERLMKMRDKAKEGLERMEDVGQMGNAEEVGNPDQQFAQAGDIAFENDIDSIIGEVDNDGAAMQTEQMFAAGGYVSGSDIDKAVRNPAVDVRYYKHADGRMMYITFINDKPMTAIPDGFNQVSAEDARQVGKKADDAADVAAPVADAGGGGGGGGDGMSSGEGGSVFGVNTLASTGLGLMAAGEKLGKVPSLTARLASKAATFAGQKIADTAIDRMSVAERAVAAPPALPGMGTFAAKNGTISTISTPAMIAASDAAMFAPTPSESLNEAIFSTPLGTEAAQTGMVTTPSGTVSNTLTTAAQDAATFDAISTGSGVGSASEAAETGMTTTDSGVTVSNDATIAAQDAAMFGDDSNSGGGGGGSSKIICTAMNQAYGFGSFRNQIWLSYAAKHLTKEHEVGYHAMFLPLVDIAFKQNRWYSKPIRKVLEWGTRHRSADLRAEMRGRKRDRTGQVIRFIFEPLCYIVGKLK